MAQILMFHDDGKSKTGKNKKNVHCNGMLRAEKDFQDASK